MNILQLNNYHFLRGGSETYYLALSKLLEENNHGVAFFSVRDPMNLKSEFSRYFAEDMSFDNNQMLFSKIKTALRMIYSFENNRKIASLLSDYKIHIAHAHNIYHRVCPSVLRILRKRDIPVILTLHDYKLGCSVYTFYRKGRLCTECFSIGRSRIVANRCTKGSLLFSGFHYLESVIHNILSLYKSNVDYFICPSLFSLKMHAEIGVPEDKLIHVPNFVFTDTFQPNYDNDGYLLFVGRLSSEKGILTLLRAVEGLDIELRIAGEGPMMKECFSFAEEYGLNNVLFEGYRSGEELRSLFRNAAFLIFPSEWYENAPMTILEAFAYGKPVIGSKIGGIPEMVIDGETGCLFTAGRHEELRDKIITLFSNPSLIKKMGQEARKRVENHHSADVHYKMLMDLYEKTIYK